MQKVSNHVLKYASKAPEEFWDSDAIFELGQPPSILSWNVNYDGRAVGEYECFDWNHRKEHVKKFITDFIDKRTQNSVVVHLQEVMPEYLQDIKECLEDTHQIFTAETHPVGRCIVSAFPKTWKCREIVINPPSEKHRRIFLKVVCEEDEEEDMVFINCHYPMDKQFRMDFAQQLVDISKDDDHIIITGDFNSFSDDGGYDQMALIEAYGDLENPTIANMVDSVTNEKALITFSAYPYDTGVPKNVKPYNLDHILVKGVFPAQPFVWKVENAITYKDVQYCASDHFALSMRFFKKNK